VDERADRLGTWTGVAAAGIVAMPVIFASSTDMNGPAVIWWAAYMLFVAAFVTDNSSLGSRITMPVPWRVRFPALVAGASVAYLIFPWGVTAVLLIIAAIAGAFENSPRWTRNQVLLQSAVIWIGMHLASGSWTEALTATVVFGAFQVFAVLMVYSRRRESAARQELASANAELRASAAVLAESSRASERVRIARELHDLVGHQLTALSLELEVASHKADGDARTHVLRARGTAKDLLSDVRKAVSELRARTPGLERPLRELVDDLPNLEVSLNVVEDIEVDEQTALTVLRCVQELVTNTLRHAQARQMWITVHADPDAVRVDVRDDGQGAPVVAPGNGLIGMRERVEQLGGQLRVTSAAGRGFRVKATVPVS
jgi:signal transduction histidine kinase